MMWIRMLSLALLLLCSFSPNQAFQIPSQKYSLLVGNHRYSGKCRPSSLWFRTSSSSDSSRKHSLNTPDSLNASLNTENSTETPLSKLSLLKGSKEDGEVTENKFSSKQLVAFIIAAGAAALYGAVHSGIDFNGIFQESVDVIESLGPWGYFYFGALYVAAEVLAIPAAPLTASSGYLFGLVPGFLTGLVFIFLLHVFIRV